MHKNDTLLRLSNVRKVYKTRFVETNALSNISFEIAAGEFVSIAGPSGSGKTTLLNVLGLLDEIDEGAYSLNGDDVSRLNDHARSTIRNRSIGFVFQQFNLLPRLTALANVALPLTYRNSIGKQERLERAERVLERVGLASRKHHFPPQLSGGQQQRVAIARALVGNPIVLLADEPTGNLDTEMSQGVMELLQEIHGAGTTVILVTHDPKLAAAAQRTIRLVDGMISNAREWAQRTPALHVAQDSP